MHQLNFIVGLQEVIQRRAIVANAAAEALQEALATESIVRSLR